MMELVERLCPGPPGWALDWPALEAALPWLEALRGCAQDPRFHPEGDVLTHTRLVCEALVAHRAWRGLPAPERRLLLCAALLHDVGKPARTRTDEQGEVRSHGHGRTGARMARRILLDAPLGEREAAVALVRRHNLPLFALQRDDPARQVITASMTVRCDHLALLAEADVRGRTSDDQQELLERVELFRELCREQGCYAAPRAFASDHARFLYFAGRERDPAAARFDDTRFEVVLMAGLPAMGKDHWLRANAPDLPQVSLDDLRQELDAPSAGRQGRVIARARQQAREHLRAQRPFAWNATNLTRQLRRQLIELFSGYRARVRIVYVEAPLATCLRRNRARAAPVPEAVIHKLLDRLEVPDLTEAHALDRAKEMKFSGQALDIARKQR